MKLWLIVPLSAALFMAGCTKTHDPSETQADTSAAKSPPGWVQVPPDSPKLSQIKVEAVRTAEVPVDEVVAPGTIQADPNRLAHIVTPLAGRIVAVRAGLGDFVRKGAPLFEVESPDAEAAVSAYLQAEAGVNQAKSAQIKAQADYDRLRDLFEHDAVARKEVLNAEAALAQAKAGVEQAQAARNQAAGRLRMLGLEPGSFGQRVIVRAPISGKVLDIAVAPGEFRNDTNTALMTVADLSTVWVTSDVPENAIRFIRLGEQLQIELAAYPGETFHARVTRIADVVDPQTHTVKVRAEMDNPSGRFRPDMFGRIRHVETTRVMPVVPSGAVIQGEGANYVFVERGPGKFQQTTVEVASRLGDDFAVTAGVQPGDRVVTEGVMLLKGT